MEASPRQHLDGDQQRLDAGDESVRALGDRILIERLTVADERAAKVVRERAEAGTAPTETVAKAIEIGARVIDSESTATNVDYVQRVFEERVGRLHEDLSDTLDQGSAEIAKHIADRFDVERADSVQGEIKEMLTTAARFQQEQLHRALTSEDGPLTAVQQRTVQQVLEAEDRHRKQLTDLREAHAKESRALSETHTKESRRLQGEIAQLKEQVSVFVERTAGEELVAEAEEAGTRKGFSFEERVNDAIERIAALRGDCATHTGGEGAEGGGKKGDTLVEVGAGSGPASGRIVFESKDRKLSKNEAWKELDDAMAARAASFAVLVVAGEDRVPSGREPLHEYEGNKLIVAVDREDPDGAELALAYRLALARVAMARDRNLTVDAGEVRAATEEALTCLKQAQAIRSSLTGIKTSADKARGGIDAMVAAIEEKLERIDSLVAEAADEDDGADAK
jgi:hypothetical protein